MEGQNPQAKETTQGKTIRKIGNHLEEILDQTAFLSRLVSIKDKEIQRLSKELEQLKPQVQTLDLPNPEEQNETSSQEKE